MTLTQFINSVITHAFGLAFVAGILGFMWYRVASLRWHPFAEHYGQVRETPSECKWMQRVIIHGDAFAHHSYSGIVTVGVSRTGVHFSLLPPWSIFHQPLFIPYSDMTGSERRWYLFNAIEIETRKAGNIRMVVYPELWQWIEKHAKANERNDDRYHDRYYNDDRYYSKSDPRLYGRA